VKKLFIRSLKVTPETRYSPYQEIPLLLPNPKFIIMFTRPGHWFISCARWIQFISSYLISLKFAVF